MLGVSDFLGVELPLWSCDPGRIRAPVILGISEHLGVGLSLGVVGVGAEPVSQVCSQSKFKLEGTYATDWAGVPAFLDSGVPSYSGWWAKCCGLTRDPGCVRAPGG